MLYAPTADAPEDERPRPASLALKVVAAILVAAAASRMAVLLVPTVLAAVLAIGFSPVADWLQRRLGLGRALASLGCMLAVAAGVALTLVLVAYQAGSIVQQSARYTKRFSELMARGSERVGGTRLMESLGFLEGDETTPAPQNGHDQDSGKTRPADRQAAPWSDLLRRNAESAGAWIASGVGGFLGFLGGLVIFLALLFYLLHERSEWLARIEKATTHLGLEPRPAQLDRIRREIQTFLGCLGLVALGYVVVVSLGLWAIGVPQPLLWGLLAGVLEVVPYFGPLVASILPLIVALSLGSWWQPAAVLALYAGLHTVEGYAITPMLYGRAMRFDPVTVLLGVLFFGWLWGPLGLAVAMPTLILLRGLIEITPDTPALDALLDTRNPGASRGGSQAGGSGGSGSG